MLPTRCSSSKLPTHSCREFVLKNRACFYFALTIACLTSGGCSLAQRVVVDRPGEGPGAPDERASPQTFLITVTVRNRSSSNASVTALEGRRRRTLGTIGSQESKEFRTRWGGRSTLIMEVRFREGRPCRTEALTVMAGDQVELVIHDSPNRTVAGAPPSYICGASSR